MAHYGLDLPGPSNPPSSASRLDKFQYFSLETHFERPGWADHLNSGVQDQTGQYGETLSLQKVQKLTGHGGERWLTSIIPALWEAEEGDHEVRSSRPAWTRCRNPVSTENTKISQAKEWFLRYDIKSTSKKMKKDKLDYQNLKILCIKRHHQENRRTFLQIIYLRKNFYQEKDLHNSTMTTKRQIV
ncbi:putative uncharacterized protein C8orf44 [Plecturocebus cupreus]